MTSPVKLSETGGLTYRQVHRFVTELWPQHRVGSGGRVALDDHETLVLQAIATLNRSGLFTGSGMNGVPLVTARRIDQALIGHPRDTPLTLVFDHGVTVTIPLT
jgi:hypothetical protein